ncbi:helix-turn-helix domain-containing protein [Balneolaceae bacterium YR4-1]|uniref:Helix-turn-helix domain-containing protein n=1 Tax=Halalkalibaculum roseum TaxID=2709311 RepID=A0A6M1T5P5_9BACT|nr:helix-turn-helix domain-containing protein [Halalkalibaculum roseum]NGP75623.1 helix-turn-helix domain-containing protein [Halalkalibaculum roseum]
MQHAYIPTKEELEDIISRVTRETVNEVLPGAIRKATRNEWLTTDDVMEMLQCSRRHVQYLRDSKQLPFSQNGRTIRYHIEDVEAFLNDHKVE